MRSSCSDSSSQPPSLPPRVTVTDAKQRCLSQVKPTEMYSTAAPAAVKKAVKPKVKGGCLLFNVYFQQRSCFQPCCSSRAHDSSTASAARLTFVPLRRRRRGCCGQFFWMTAESASFPCAPAVPAAPAVPLCSHQEGRCQAEEGRGPHQEGDHWRCATAAGGRRVSSSVFRRPAPGQQPHTTSPLILISECS